MATRHRKTTSNRAAQGAASKARLDALLDAAVDAIILIDSDGRITHFNLAAESMFGFTSAEVIGHNVNCLMPQPYRHEHDGYLDRYLKTGEARIIGIGREVTGQRKDGSHFPIELSVGEIKQQHERGFVGIIRDITQRKHFEIQLRHQKEELRLIFESAPTAIVTVASDGRLLNGNQAWLDLLGNPEQDGAILSCRDIIHADDYPDFELGISKLKQGKADTWRSNIRLVIRADQPIYARMQVGILRELDGAQFLIMELVDQTAQVQAERDAIDLRKNLAHMLRLNTMGEMATGIAHELNQPLTAIAAYAQASRRLITKDRAELPMIVETLDKIAAQAERAGEVIRRLRAMLTKQDSQREVIDCSVLIRDIVRLAEVELSDSDMSIQLHLEEGLPPVSIDSVQMQQVILNLLRNAMEAMAEAASGNEIIISACMVTAHSIEISISDCGPGIGDAAAPQLFEAFYTTKPRGLGMGLAICKSIAESHDGTLKFMNNRYGGATFTLSLPTHLEWAES